MCRVLEVAPSGYYDWLLQPISNRAQEDARLLRLIRASFVAGHGIYGAPASSSICVKPERPAASIASRG
jgi:putative transposase